MESAIIGWNEYITNFQIKLSDLQNPKPAFFIEAYLELFKTVFEIDSDVVLRGPPIDDQSDEHEEYYADLLPVINIIKAIKVLVLDMSNKQFQPIITVGGVLFPNPNSMQSMFSILVNFAMFANYRISEVKDRVENVFALQEDIDAMINEKERLLREENEISAETASRAERMQKYEEEIEICTKQLQEAKARKENLMRDHETWSKHYEEVKILVDQKKLLKDGVQKEITKIQSEIVTDADDVRDQHETAIRIEQKAKEKMEHLKQALNDKNNSVNTFNLLQKKLDSGTILLEDVIALAEQLRQGSKFDPGEVSSMVELNHIQKELSDEKSAHDKIRNEMNKEDEEYHKRIEELNAELQEAHLAEKEAEALHDKIATEKKCDMIADLKSSTIKFDVERKKLFDQMNADEDDAQKQIYEYQKSLIGIMDSMEKEINKRLSEFSRFPNRFNQNI